MTQKSAAQLIEAVAFAEKYLNIGFPAIYSSNLMKNFKEEGMCEMEE
jgi:hypothetical protein